MQKIEQATGVKRDPERCQVYKPQNRRKRPIDPKFFDYMIEHIDWEAEALIGYKLPSFSVTDFASLNEFSRLIGESRISIFSM